MRYNEKTVIDADAPETIRVMRRDIDKAVPANPHECAIAQCMKRGKNVIDANVGANVVLVTYKNGKVKRFVLSPEDRRRIRDFDKAGYFRPDTYTLLPPPPRARIGARAGTKSGTNVRGTGAKRSVYHTPPTRVLKVSG